MALIQTNNQGAHRAGRRLGLLLSVSFTLTLLFSSNVPAQIKISALVKGRTPLQRTSEIRLIQLADLNETDVSLGMPLEPGDELSCPGGGITMEIRFGNTRFKASGQFRFVVLVSEGRDITVQLLTGVGHMQASKPTGVSSGETIMGTRHTEYEVRVYRKAARPFQECIVYEGEVVLVSQLPKTVSLDDPEALKLGYELKGQPKPKPFNVVLSSGEKISVNSFVAKPAPEKVDKVDIDRAATLYAQVDTAKALMAKTDSDPDEVYKRLVSRYWSVLADPANSGLRLHLAVDQVNFNIGDDAIYQLNKAEQYTPPEDIRSRATIAMTRGVAFAQAGRTNEATQEYKKAQTLDGSVFSDANLTGFGFDNRIKAEIKSGASGAGEGDAETNDQDSLFNLLNNGHFQEALNGFQGRMKSGQANSRDYYGTAEAYFSLGTNSAATKNAQAALMLNKKDSRLSKNDYQRAEFILKQTQPSPTPTADASAQGLRPSEGSRRTWPRPAALSSRQAEVFKLIEERNFDLADRAMRREDVAQNWNSIDYYAQAIIQYEKKDIKAANLAAETALKLSGRDQLLSGDAYAACKQLYTSATKP